jgi:hypothetical protein
LNKLAREYTPLFLLGGSSNAGSDIVDGKVGSIIPRLMLDIVPEDISNQSLIALVA